MADAWNNGSRIHKLLRASQIAIEHPPRKQIRPGNVGDEAENSRTGFSFPVLNLLSYPPSAR